MVYPRSITIARNPIPFGKSLQQGPEANIKQVNFLMFYSSKKKNGEKIPTAAIIL